jgi:hypothetical protein
MSNFYTVVAERQRITLDFTDELMFFDYAIQHRTGNGTYSRIASPERRTRSQRQP